MERGERNAIKIHPRQSPSGYLRINLRDANNPRKLQKACRKFTTTLASPMTILGYAEDTRRRIRRCKLGVSHVLLRARRVRQVYNRATIDLTQSPRSLCERDKVACACERAILSRDYFKMQIASDYKQTAAKKMRIKVHTE